MSESFNKIELQKHEVISGKLTGVVVISSKTLLSTYYSDQND